MEGGRTVVTCWDLVLQTTNVCRSHEVLLVGLGGAHMTNLSQGTFRVPGNSSFVLISDHWGNPLVLSLVPAVGVLRSSWRGQGVVMLPNEVFSDVVVGWDTVLLTSHCVGLPTTVMVSSLTDVPTTLPLLVRLAFVGRVTNLRTWTQVMRVRVTVMRLRKGDRWRVFRTVSTGSNVWTSGFENAARVAVVL